MIASYIKHPSATIRICRLFLPFHILPSTYLLAIYELSFGGETSLLSIRYFLSYSIYLYIPYAVYVKKEFGIYEENYCDLFKLVFEGKKVLISAGTIIRLNNSFQNVLFLQTRFFKNSTNQSLVFLYIN